MVCMQPIAVTDHIIDALIIVVYYIEIPNFHAIKRLEMCSVFAFNCTLSAYVRAFVHICCIIFFDFNGLPIPELIMLSPDVRHVNI